MKRMHLHVSVPDLAQSIRFYETLFGAPPSVVQPDYAKWQLEDPRVNFAISRRGAAPGIQHLGIQAEDEAELLAIDGYYQTADEIADSLRNRPAQAWLEGEMLRITALN